MSDVLDRFIKYCAVPSQSNPLTAEKVPSTPEQFDIANVIAQDLRELGAEDVAVDEHAYVTAHWPASEGCEDLPCLGFCCHIDTAWQSVGSPVHPEVKHYEGGELRIGTDRDGREVVVSPETNPQLANMAGWDIVTTDGTSLLGGDDKAGDAMVVSLLARLKADPSLPHPRLALSFVPDEEIGHGAALLDLKEFGADFGYTIDGGPLGEFCYETFNAGLNTLHFNFGNKVVNGAAVSTYGVEWNWMHDSKWNYYETTIDNVKYNVYYADYYQKLPAGETTEQFISGVYLDKSFDMKDGKYYAFDKEVDLTGLMVNGELKVSCPVKAVACQADGFDSVEAAITAAFGANYNPFGGTATNWQ